MGWVQPEAWPATLHLWIWKQCVVRTCWLNLFLCGVCLRKVLLRRVPVSHQPVSLGLQFRLILWELTQGSVSNYDSHVAVCLLISQREYLPISKKKWRHILCTCELHFVWPSLVSRHLCGRRAKNRTKYMCTGWYCEKNSSKSS